MTWEPSRPFMEGHKADPAQRARILNALRSASFAHPTMRLGQLIYNATRGVDLFIVNDEYLAIALEEYAKKS